jgi:hypothetical protein
MEAARAVVADVGERYVRLPDPFQIDEWNMMRLSAGHVGNGERREALLRAIHGRGALRCLRDRIHEPGIAEAWYSFRGEQFRRIALEWCADHGVEVDPKA